MSERVLHLNGHVRADCKNEAEEKGRKRGLRKTKRWKTVMPAVSIFIAMLSEIMLRVEQVKTSLHNSIIQQENKQRKSDGSTNSAMNIRRSHQSERNRQKKRIKRRKRKKEEKKMKKKKNKEKVTEEKRAANMHTCAAS